MAAAILMVSALLASGWLTGDKKIAPYTVMDSQHYAIGQYDHIEIRLMLQQRGLSDDQIHDALLDAARKYPGPLVVVFGYWPGDDWHSLYSAGKLVWSKDGHGWDREERLSASGDFSPWHGVARPATATNMPRR